MLHRIDGAVQELAKRFGAALEQKIGGIQAIGERHDPQIDLLGYKQAENFVGPPLAGLVAIQYQRDRIGESSQQTNMPFPQRGSQHGDGVIESKLSRDDRVSVTFHDHCHFRARSRRGRIHSVEHAAFREQRCLGRIDVLRAGCGWGGRYVSGSLRKNSSAQRDRPALHIANREQHSAAEAIVMPAAAILADDQADRFKRLCCDFGVQRLLDQPVPAIRRIAQAESLDALG